MCWAGAWLGICAAGASSSNSTRSDCGAKAAANMPPAMPPPMMTISRAVSVFAAALLVGTLFGLHQFFDVGHGLRHAIGKDFTTFAGDGDIILNADANATPLTGDTVIIRRHINAWLYCHNHARL